VGYTLVANSGNQLQALYNWSIDDRVYIDYVQDLSEMCLHHAFSLFAITCWVQIHICN